jgi:hypothetical protein
MQVFRGAGVSPAIFLISTGHKNAAKHRRHNRSRPKLIASLGSTIPHTFREIQIPSVSFSGFLNK